MATNNRTEQIAAMKVAIPASADPALVVADTDRSTREEEMDNIAFRKQETLTSGTTTGTVSFAWDAAGSRGEIYIALTGALQINDFSNAIQGDTIYLIVSGNFALTWSAADFIEGTDCEFIGQFEQNKAPQNTIKVTCKRANGTGTNYYVIEYLADKFIEPWTDIVAAGTGGSIPEFSTGWSSSVTCSWRYNRATSCIEFRGRALYSGGGTAEIASNFDSVSQARYIPAHCFLLGATASIQAVIFNSTGMEFSAVGGSLASTDLINLDGVIVQLDA